MIFSLLILSFTVSDFEILFMVTVEKISFKIFIIKGLNFKDIVEEIFEENMK